MTQLQFIKNLVQLLEIANNADSENANPYWQKPEDANSQRLWGDLNSALIRVAGDDFAEWLSSTGEINEDLIENRMNESIVVHNPHTIDKVREIA